MKGKYKIELFDVSKQPTSKIEGSNIVTNIYKNVYSGWHNAAPLNSDNFWDGATNVLSSPSNFSNGLVLFSDNIKSGINDIIRDKPIFGNAGGVYAGTDTKRGNLVTLESGAITNGHRYVWEFASDKCNGVISAMGLVPQVVGDGGSWGGGLYNRHGSGDNNYYPRTWLGCLKLRDDLSEIRFNPNTLSVVKYNNVAVAYSASNKIRDVVESLNLGVIYDNFVDQAELVDDYYYLICRKKSDLKFYLLKIDTDVLSIVDEFLMSNMTAATLQWGFLTPNKVGRLKTNASTVVWEVYNINTRSYESDFTHTRFIRTPSSHRLKLHCFKDFTLITSFMDSLGDAVNYAQLEVAMIIDHSTMAVIPGNSSHAYYGVNYTTYYNTNSVISLNGVPVIGLNYNQRASGYSYGGLGYYIPGIFLFSRINLETPITKTSAQTMKITYELTW
jgi:hypothetical protein